MSYIAVARRGFDLRTASDSDKLFDTRFPSLIIHKRLKFELDLSGPLAVGQFKEMYRHSLGYVPVFVALRSVDDDEYNITSEVWVDENFVYVNKPTSTGTYHYLVYLFYKPVFDEFTAPNVASTGEGQGVAGGASMTISRPGYTVDDDDDFRNFVIHPDTKTLTVHKTGSFTYETTDTGFKYVDIEHNLGYQPLYWLYLNYESGYTPTITQFIYFLPNTGSPYSPSIDNQELHFIANQPGEWGYVIFKDPVK